MLLALAVIFSAGCKGTATVDASAETNPALKAKGAKVQSTTAENVN